VWVACVSFLRFDQEQTLAGMFVYFLGIAACFGHSSFVLETFCAVAYLRETKFDSFLYGACVRIYCTFCCGKMKDRFFMFAEKQ